MDFNWLSTRLKADTANMGLHLSEANIKKIQGYLELLDKWNQVHNLSGIKDIHQMVAYHIVDSLSIVPYIQGHNICDVGTGAGLPSIPVSIVMENHHFHLIESRQKKISFLNQAKLHLNLENITVERARVESFNYPLKFDMVISRAFASLKDFILLSAYLLKPGGLMLAMKGQLSGDELEGVPKGFKIVKFIPVNVAGVIGERNLVLIKAH